MGKGRLCVPAAGCKQTRAGTCRLPTRAPTHPLHPTLCRRTARASRERTMQWCWAAWCRGSAWRR